MESIDSDSPDHGASHGWHNFFYMFVFISFFIVHHGLERRLRMHFRHSLGSVNISGGGFIDLGDGMDWGWEMGMNGEIRGRRNISC